MASCVCVTPPTPTFVGDVESISPPTASCVGDCECVVPPTPTCVADFSHVWLRYVLDGWLEKKNMKTEFDILNFSATLNSSQGLLSTTYIIDIVFRGKQKQEQHKSIFLKVPLYGKSSNYREAHIRENLLQCQVLPKLQYFIDQNCTDKFVLPIPETIYVHSCGNGLHDALILQNLNSEGFVISEELGVENLKSCLRVLTKLHGTVLAYKHHVGGTKQLWEELNELKEPALMKDILGDRDTRKCVKRNYLPFLKYLEISDPSLVNYTTFLANISSKLFHTFLALDTSGVDNLFSICHGDCKPANFMFRRQENESAELEGILFDWQAAFLDFITNDLMRLLPPFLARNPGRVLGTSEGIPHNPELLKFALEFYCAEMKKVLQTFGKSLKTVNLPEDPEEFVKLVKRCVILDLFNAVVINPIFQIQNPPDLRNWYRRRIRHEAQMEQGKPSQPPVFPQQKGIFPRKNFLKFVTKYLEGGYLIGGFEELSRIILRIDKEISLGYKHDPEADEHEDDIYEDEEKALSDEEDEEDVDSLDIEPSWSTKCCQALSKMFFCDKIKRNRSIEVLTWPENF